MDTLLLDTTATERGAKLRTFLSSKTVGTARNDLVDNFVAPGMSLRLALEPFTRL